MRFRFLQAGTVKNISNLLPLFGAIVFLASPAVYAQGRVVQTIDLRTWAGTPVPVVVPPAPVPAPGFSLTGIAFNPANHTIYVSDYATTNVYAIDSVTNTVQSAVYTNGLFASADIGATQNLPGT